MEHRPIIGITMGDPVGVGPEIVLKALREGGLYQMCRPLVLGDAQVLLAGNRAFETGLRIHTVAGPETALFRPGTVDVVSLSQIDPAVLKPGVPTEETGRAMVAYIRHAIAWAMERRIAGLTTAPINKAAMHRAGFHFDGHTEILAADTATRDYVMMLAGERLRVSIVTIHKALRRVPEILTSGAVAKTILITDQGLRESFGIPTPRLAVAGLNPHAGEGGLFGNEEEEIIAPAVEQAQRAGVSLSGPHPPDTVFYRASEGAFDAVVAMYHDQGLIPFKMVHFTDGVNTTLGLPIVRTSVDHGTAYDIAGTGQADPGSLAAAVAMAAVQAVNRAGK